MKPFLSLFAVVGCLLVSTTAVHAAGTGGQIADLFGIGIDSSPSPSTDPCSSASIYDDELNGTTPPLSCGTSSASGSSSGSSTSTGTTSTSTNSTGSASTSTSPTPTPVAANPPDSTGECHMVLVTYQASTESSVANSKPEDCDQLDFDDYLSLLIDQLVPYVMLVALIMIVYSGFQYMMGGAAGDVKAARARITGILGGIIFFFLIRLILNQIAPDISINATASSSASPSVSASPVSTSIAGSS